MGKRVQPNVPLFIIHIVTTVGLLGADLALLSLAIAGARGWDAQNIYPAAHVIVTWLVAPLAIASLGTGIVLGLSTKWGLLRYPWVTAKLITTTVLTIVLLLVLVPGLGRAAQLAIATPELLTDGQRMRFAIAPAVAATLLTLNVVLAVYKPRRKARVEGGR